MIHRKKNDLLHTQKPHHMSVSSQPLAGRIHSKSKTGRKQAQDSPGTLHSLFGGVMFLPVVVVVVVVVGGEGVTLIYRKKILPQRRHVPAGVVGSLMCFSKLIHLLVKRSVLRSTMPVRFRGPQTGGMFELHETLQCSPSTSL